MTWYPKAPLCRSCGWIHKIPTPNPCERPNSLDCVTTKRKLSPRLPHDLRKAEARELKSSFESFYPIYGFTAKTDKQFLSLAFTRVVSSFVEPVDRDPRCTLISCYFHHEAEKQYLVSCPSQLRRCTKGSVFRSKDQS